MHFVRADLWRRVLGPKAAHCPLRRSKQRHSTVRPRLQAARVQTLSESVATGVSPHYARRLVAGDTYVHPLYFL